MVIVRPVRVAYLSLAIGELLSTVTLSRAFGGPLLIKTERLCIVSQPLWHAAHRDSGTSGKHRRLQAALPVGRWRRALLVGVLVGRHQRLVVAAPLGRVVDGRARAAAAAAARRARPRVDRHHRLLRSVARH